MKELSASLDSCIEVLTVPLETGNSSIVHSLFKRQEGRRLTLTLEQFLDAFDTESRSQIFAQTITVNDLIVFAKTIDKNLSAYIRLKVEYESWRSILHHAPELVEHMVLQCIYGTRQVYINNNNQWPQYMIDEIYA